MKDIFFLLNKSHKKKIYFLAILILFLALFEFLTFSLIEPIISIFSSKNIDVNLNFFKFFDFNKELTKSFIIYSFFIFFLLRSILSLLISYFKTILSKDINDYLSNKLYTYYLNKDYLFFLKQSSSFFNSNIIKEVDNFAMRLMDSLIYLLTDIVIILTIISFLTISYPLETLILFLISSGMFLIYYLFFRARLKKLGINVTKNTSSRIKFLEDSFYIIQNIKLDQSEKFFIKKFRELTNNTSDSTRKINFILDAPKSFIEITMMVVIFALIFYVSLFFDLDPTKIVPILGLFVFALFRILPSFNRVLSAFNMYKAYYGSIAVIKNQLINFDKFMNDKKNNNQMLISKSIFESIEFNKVSFGYSSNNEVLDNISLNLKIGEIVGIIGDNGSGKSTLLNIMSGLLNPTTGKILVDDTDLKSISDSYKKKIGYVTQKIYLSDDTIRNNIILGQDEKNFDQSRYEKALNLSKLNEVLKKFKEKDNTVVGERGIILSGGQQQRIGIARAIYKKPHILILDEATNALDFETEKKIINEITQLKNETFIVLVSHNKKIFENCDRIFELKSKKLNIIK